MNAIKMKEVLSQFGIVDNVDHNDPTVKKLESRGSVVVNVFKQAINLMGDVVEMTNYLIVSKEDTVSSLKADLKRGYMFAYVVNHDWDIEEYGSVGIEVKNGKVVRTW